MKGKGRPQVNPLTLDAETRSEKSSPKVPKDYWKLKRLFHEKEVGCGDSCEQVWLFS